MPKGKLLNGLVTQQKVLRGAVALFLEKGYTRTTTGEIAKAAGIMRGFMSVPCDLYFTMDAKVTRFLDCALKLYDVPAEKRKAVTAAVLALDLHEMAAGIIRKTVQQAEAGFEALSPEVDS